MATTYESFVGGRGSIDYITAPETLDYGGYPTPDQVSIFGPLYLPRVYGKDLTSFEIASSGTIALTIRDVNSLSLDRELAESNVILKTLCNDSLILNVNDSNVFMKMDGLSNNITLSADSNINMIAGDQFNVFAADLAWNISSDITFAASNDLNLRANSNVNIWAQNDSIVMAADNSNITLLFDQTNKNLVGYANSNIVMTAGGDVTVVGGDAIAMSANAGTFTAYAQSSNMSLTLNASTSNATLYAVGAVTLDALDDVNLYANSNVFISAESQDVLINAANSNVEIEMLSTTYTMNLNATSNINTVALNDVTTTASSNVTIAATSGSFTLSASDSNMLLTMSEATNMTTLYSSNDVIMNTSNDFLLTSIGATTITSLSTAVSSTNNISLTSSAGSVSFYGSNNSTSLIMDAATASITVNASNDFNLNVTSNIDVKVLEGASIASGTNVTIATSNNTSITSGVNTTVTSQTGTVLLSGSNNQVQLQLSGTTKDATLSASNDVILDAGRHFNVLADSNMTLSASNSMTIQTNNTNSYMTLGTNFETKAAQYNWLIGNTSMMTLTSDKLFINGNLEITGVLDAVNVQQTNLLLEDKNIILASSSNGSVNDGIANNGSGIVVNGLSAMAQTNPNVTPFQEKSFKWNNGVDGVDVMGTSNMDKESFWELKGGSLRMTMWRYSSNNDGTIASSNEIGFGFRINNYNELEIVKKYMNNDQQYVYKRIAKFGQTLNL